ncbi:Retrovirus-related Pol polyprotein from transposon TNT 1-94 [Senna tora]|uniref:Retrovirus-related Pol polyprotein from transposon TNT 1-94 n=1 Tax=Senna tora TaxID=362788 RepID=A0A834WFI6_9FABA|nr:Retrovirus-related Pol polyprotein from transposon TNT 1-94 [Senna tora]
MASTTTKYEVNMFGGGFNFSLWKIMMQSHPKKPFVDSMLYGKESISLDNVSNAPKSKELKRIFPDNKAEDEELVTSNMRGRRKNHRKSIIMYLHATMEQEEDELLAGPQLHMGIAWR